MHRNWPCKRRICSRYCQSVLWHQPWWFVRFASSATRLGNRCCNCTMELIRDEQHRSTLVAGRDGGENFILNLKNELEVLEGVCKTVSSKLVEEPSSR
mmetsp:Transcript_19369/g.34014  ORF Transcript_19369/g.34014 Transcript_19369/m.34014 type:complete len:98 (-) Transcript_19369:71-364(-)